MIQGLFSINGQVATIQNQTTALGYDYPYYYRLYNDSGYSHTAKDLNGVYCVNDGEYLIGVFNGDTSGTKLEVLYDNAAHAGGMFNQCSNLNYIPDNCLNNVITGAWMFADCDSLQEVPSSCLKQVINARSMFHGCTSLTSIPTFDNLVHAHDMFYLCNSLTSIPDYSFNKVNYALDMFSHCSGLKTIPEHCFSSLASGEGMFEHCTQLTSVQCNFPVLTDANSMFIDCASLKNITNFHLDNVISANYMFKNCFNLSAIDPTKFNNVKAARQMFANCSSYYFKTFNATAGFNNVKDVRGMFSGCRYLNINAMDFIRAHSATVTANQGCFYLTNIADYYDVFNSQYKSWVTSA